MIKVRFLLISWLFLAVLLSVFSYSQIDLNLTLSQDPVYLSFQEQLIQLGYYQRVLATTIFVGISLGLIAVYLLSVRQAFAKKVGGWRWWPWLLGLSVILILGYPAFSHDIFNYLFNAKMVWVYGANPHREVAANFSFDPWVRFMRNVHTPAPYAYGWTGISLLPGLVTLTGNFKLSLWVMKSFVVMFWVGQLWLLVKLVKKYFPKQKWRWVLFAFNPLVLTETLMVGHNDVVMMFLVLASLWFLLQAKKIISQPFLISLGLGGLSVLIKYASVVLLPLYFIKAKYPDFDFAKWGSLALLLVMFTRPDQLHSWYLIWGFSLAVLAKSRWLVAGFTAATFGALLRYTPYLFYGNWDPPVYGLRNLIWAGVAVLGIFTYGMVKKSKQRFWLPPAAVIVLGLSALS